MFDPKFYEDEQQDSPAPEPVQEPWQHLMLKKKRQDPQWVIAKILGVVAIFGLALLFASGTLP